MQNKLTYLSKFSNSCVCLIIFLFAFPKTSYTQTKDTSQHQLQEVIVIETKKIQFEDSKKTISIDSLTLSRYNTSSLSELLSHQSAIHIKSYGNGNTATTSMRGGNANHTAILWNGLNIQNAMLGQTDLSIIPSAFFDQISLEYGGASAMWGSGAIGGSIHLQNNTLFNQGYKTKLQLSIGSFDTRKINTGVLLSYKKIISNTKLYSNNSSNNYTYKDTADKENTIKKITHADFTARGILQEFNFIVTPFQRLNIRAWYNVVDRNLPSYTNSKSEQSQQDENLKLSADWNYHKRKLNATVRLAYFNDKLNYTDSIAKIFSKNSVKTIIAESDNIYNFKNHTFNLGVNFTKYSSASYAIDTLHQLNKLALFAAYKLNLFHSKLLYTIAVRKETTNLTSIPFTGNTGLYYKITNTLTAKINANKSYRQPTLNDLYWNPGGNRNLKPEDSYEVDGGMVFNYSKHHYQFNIEATYFNRHTKNWIMWLPTEYSYWSPINIAEVYSRGTETKTEFVYKKKDLVLKYILHTSYVLSTNLKLKNENDNSLGRQLMYTPRYTGQGTFIAIYHQASILFNTNYTGYRFTSTDNTTWMNPYFIGNLKFSYNHSFGTMNVEFFGTINNVFNKNYMVVQSRPMPLRNYEIGICLNYTKKKTSTSSVAEIQNNKQ